MKPIKTFGEYTVCIDQPAEDDISARKHFITECGWSSAEFNKIKNFPWFRVEVSIWKNGEEMAIDHLGCCSYKTRKEFYTTYESDYFADMVHNCALEIMDQSLIDTVNLWRESFSKAVKV